MAQIAPPRAPLRPAVAQQISVYNQGHPRAPIDPAAALAVAAQEGLGGRIGDGGHAFGPFQLNNAGGVLTGRFPGETPEQLQAWATSPEGIQYALAGIGRVAGGKRGPRAVRDIVAQFERPADIPGEISRALSALGASPVTSSGAPLATAALGRSATTAAPPVQPGPDYRAELAHQLATAAATPTNDLSSFYATLTRALQARQAAQHPGTVAPPVTPSVTPQSGGLVARPGEQPPTRNLPLARGQVLGNTVGENAGFLASLAALAAYEHAPVDINSGYRSTAKQAQLYANRASNPNPVAPPGHSLHEQGLAADGTVGGIPLGKLPAALLARFGLAAVPGDPVHVQVRR